MKPGIQNGVRNLMVVVLKIITESRGMDAGRAGAARGRAARARRGVRRRAVARTRVAALR
jgi:hypothetical protein